MPSSKDPILGIHASCTRGHHETGPISGCGVVGIVQRFGLEINLAKTHGVHWRRFGTRSTDEP
jgi:hypothetical protein